MEHETADCVGVEGATLAVFVHVLFQIHLAVFEDENEFSLCMNDIVKTDDVDVFELFHEGDFADGGGWSALLCIKMDFFESNDFIGRS